MIPIRRRFASASPDTRVIDAIPMAGKTDHHLVILDRDDVVGVTCTCDLHKAKPGAKVAEVMNRNVLTIAATSSIDEAAQMMRENGVAFLPVMAGGLMIGVLGTEDLRASGVSLEALGKRECEACGSLLHVREDPRNGTAACLFCRERGGDDPENTDTGAGD